MPRSSPGPYFLLVWLYFGLIFGNCLAYVGVVLVRFLASWGCCLISLFGPVGNNAGNNSDNNVFNVWDLRCATDEAMLAAAD